MAHLTVLSTASTMVSQRESITTLLNKGICAMPSSTLVVESLKIEQKEYNLQVTVCQNPNGRVEPLQENTVTPY